MNPLKKSLPKNARAKVQLILLFFLVGAYLLLKEVWNHVIGRLPLWTIQLDVIIISILSIILPRFSVDEIGFQLVLAIYGLGGIFFKLSNDAGLQLHSLWLAIFFALSGLYGFAKLAANTGDSR